MNTDELIEQIHAVNMQCRQNEHSKDRIPRIAWRIAVPAISVAAIMLIILLPRNNEVQASVPTGIYCNSQCNPNDVLALIDNNIKHIKTIQSL